MVLRWLGGSSDTDVDGLIARQKFGKALELIRTQLETRRGDQRLRLLLSDVLVKAGRGPQAVPVLLELADELATAGFAAKAIALVKKAQRIEPGRAEVEARLAALLGAAAVTLPAAAPGTARMTPLSVVPDAPEVAAVPRADEAPMPASEPASPVVDGTFRDEVLDIIEDVLRPLVMDDDRAASLARGHEIATSPLFGDFTQEELLAVIRGLRLLLVETGDIIVSEGETGSSLFVLATGTVKAFVRNPNGRNLPVRELHDGDFFGEISVLSEGPRTATITAATRCELLELDRRALELITAAHPRVRWVLQQFAEERANSSIEAAIRAMKAAAR